MKEFMNKYVNKHTFGKLKKYRMMELGEAFFTCLLMERKDNEEVICIDADFPSMAAAQRYMKNFKVAMDRWDYKSGLSVAGEYKFDGLDIRFANGNIIRFWHPQSRMKRLVDSMILSDSFHTTTGDY